MSLTSYRAAPPRVMKGLALQIGSNEANSFRCTGIHCHRRVSRRQFRRCVLSRRLGRPGSDLLSHVLRRSTIGAEGFHGRVRNGIECRPLAMTTRSSKQAAKGRCHRHAGIACKGNEFGSVVSHAQIRACANIECGTASGLSLRTVHTIKPIELLVPVSCMRYRMSTPGLSTWWSTTALFRET